MKSSLKPRHFGQSLSEYSLVIGLVALACIGGVAILGTQIQEEMGNAMGANAPAGSSVVQIPKALSAPFTQQKGFFLTPQEIQSILDQSPKETLILGNGKSITIPKPNLVELQETLGPNGSTELALALVQRIQEAMRKEELDPETLIPELSMFANEGHRVSKEQRRIESGIALHGQAFSMLSVIQRETEHLSTPTMKFSKNSRGEYEVSNFYQGTTKYEGPPININDFPNRSKPFIKSELVKQTLQSRPDLQGLTQPFSRISETVLKANQTLDFVATNVTENKTPEKKAAFLEKYPWYQTKKAANDACVMSKEQTCLQ